MTQPQIVILDGYAINPGDASWEEVASLGEMRLYDFTPDEPATIIERSREADVIVVNRPCITEEILQALPKLRLITELGTGYNNIDVAAATRLGKIVCNVPGYSTASVAQHVFALLFELMIGVSRYHREVCSRQWTSDQDFTFYLGRIGELAGKTMGILGFGNIGQAVARIAQGFGMKVIFYSAHSHTSDFAEQLSFEELLRESDILSLHAPLTPETRHIIGARQLAMMKQTAYLVNVARGGLVDSAALAQALNQGKLAGAGIDVMEQEPPQNDDPLLGAKNCVITPHIAWASLESRERLIHITAENIRRVLAGSPQNWVRG